MDNDIIRRLIDEIHELRSELAKERARRKLDRVQISKLRKALVEAKRG